MNKTWTYLNLKISEITFLAAIGSVVAIVLIAYFSLGYYTRHGSGIPVPKLKGLQVNRAISMLEEQGSGIR